MALDRLSILTHDDRQLELVPVPEWGGEVYVRGITADERDAWELSMAEAKPGKSKVMRASLVALATCDETGAPLFTRADVADLGAKAAGPVDRIFEVATRLARIGKKDVEDLEKN